MVSADGSVLFSLVLNEYAEYISLDKGIVILKHEMKLVESFTKEKWLQISLMFSLANVNVLTFSQKVNWNLHGKLNFVLYSILSKPEKYR